MIEKYNIRTDLALEEQERFESDDVEISGVILEEDYDQDCEMRVTKVIIETENGAKKWENRLELMLRWKLPILLCQTINIMIKSRKS